VYLCNNHKNSRHADFYGSGAFYDIYTTDRQATLADYLTAGETCIVASEPTKGRIRFDWYKFSHEKPGRWEGKPTRVFFGEHFKSETLERGDAIRDGIYSKFFAINRRLKRQNLLRVI
jgi:hypothetical protein